MNGDTRGRDGWARLLSRRGFGRLAAALLGVAGLAASASDSAARRRRKRKPRRNRSRRRRDERARKPDASPTRADDGSSADLDAEERALLSMINAYRAQHGLGPLTHQRKLGAAAERHAEDMAINNFTGHIGSDRTSPDMRIEREGYHYLWSGENVFWGAGSARMAFAWWKSSPEHNDNLLFGRFTETGIAREYNPNTQYGWYWTNTFGSPSGVDSAARKGTRRKRR